MRKNSTRQCSITGCDRPHCAKGMCRMHWKRQWRHGDPLELKRRTPGAALAFVENAVLTCTANECIIFPFKLNDSGYGKMGGVPDVDVLEVRAHRYALCKYTGKPYDYPFEAAHGPCHNRACINPHPGHGMRWATRAENIADRIRDKSEKRGEDCVNSKMTVIKVYESIKLRKEGVAITDIAVRMGVGQTTIADILKGRTWTHVTGFDDTTGKGYGYDSTI